MEEESHWHGWEDPNGDAMFVADGPKLPLLVRVTGGGESEHVLASFTSVDAASEFQEWLDRSFAETALANQQLSMHAGGIPIPTRADIRENEGYTPPGLVDED